MSIRKTTRLLISRRGVLMGPASSPTLLGPAHSLAGRVSDFEFTPLPGMLYVTARAISSRVNANYDGWPADELRKSWQSFLGRPVFVDHTNWDPKETRGVIIDARLHESKLASGHEDVWVELLIEVDANEFPKLAKMIIDGDVDAVSMGADVEFTVCSACGNKARDTTEYCTHIAGMKGRVIPALDKVSGVKKSVLVYEDCHGVNFFEISFVFDPADESALVGDRMLFSGSVGATSSRIRDHVRMASENADAYRRRVGVMKVASKTADTALLSMPPQVDTSREENNCPVCGSELVQLGAGGVVCPNGDFEQPPDALRDPEEQQENAAAGKEKDEDGDDDDDDEDEDDQGQQKKKSPPPSKADAGDQDDQGPSKGGRESRRVDVGRFEEIVSGKTGAAGSEWSIETGPGEATAPYGAPTPPNGTITPAPEPAAVERDQLLAEEGKANVQNLDVSEVVGPQGQSEVNVVGDTAPKDDESAAGLAAAASRRTADEVAQTDVTDLDGGPMSAEQGMAAGHQEVTAPVAVENFLGEADWSPVISDGSETGLSIDPEERRRGENDFAVNDAGGAPYGQIAASTEPSRLWRIAAVADERIELGLSDREDKLGDLARLEQMPPAEFEGYEAAIKEVRAAAERGPRRRISVNAGAASFPSLARTPALDITPPAGAEQEQAEDALVFLGD